MPTLFFLSVPPTAKTAAMDGFTPTTVAEWLQKAPTANQAQFCKELCQRISEINQAGFAGQALFDLAEVLRASVLSVQSYLLARVASKAYPLSAEDQAAGEVLLNLGREYGQMYSVLLQEFDAATDASAERALGLLIHRLIRCVSLLLLAYYSLHLKVPAWLWRDMHAIYRLAMQKRKTDDRQRDAAAIHQGVSLSVAEVYLQALLLGMADPYRLQGAEILGYYQQLEAWVSAVHLRPVTGKAGCWLVQLDQDKPPFWSDAGEDKTGLSIDWQALDKQLATQIERGSGRAGRFEPQAADSTSLSLDLLRYLRRCWRNEISHIEHVADAAGISILPGFRATHAQLSATSAPAGTEGWDATLLGDGMFCCDGDITGRLVLGALLSYQPLSGGDRGLAVVDRVFLERLGGVVKFSLRKLTGHVLLGGVQPFKLDPKNPNVYQRALVYVDESAMPVRSFVILESLRQQEGGIVRLLMDTGMTFIKLARRENIALGCVRFECAEAVD